MHFSCEDFYHQGFHFYHEEVLFSLEVEMDFYVLFQVRDFFGVSEEMGFCDAFQVYDYVFYEVVDLDCVFVVRAFSVVMVMMVGDDAQI